jgi:hypothetical protein
MTPKNIFATVMCAALLAWSGLSMADEYRPDQLFGLDLPQAVLSPKPLGPPSRFEPVRIEAKGDRRGEGTHAKAAPQAEPKITMHRTRVVHAPAEKPRGAARTRLARRHSNPLDAQAQDTRVQVWPCKSGGICDWKR